MKKPTIHFTIILILLAIFLQSCDVGMQPKGDYISGNVFFADTNFAHQNGNYSIALYSRNNSPYTSVPVKTQNLEISINKPIPYKIYWENAGAYYAAVVWICNNTGSNIAPTVLGTYGCDTTHNCQNSILIAFPNYSTGSYNITCWADTTKKLN